MVFGYIQISYLINIEIFIFPIIDKLFMGFLKASQNRIGWCVIYIFCFLSEGMVKGGGIGSYMYGIFTEYVTVKYLMISKG